MAVDNEAPPVESTEQAPPEPAAESREQIEKLSIKDHEARFKRDDKRHAPTAAQPAATVATAEGEEGERDEQGRFKNRHRAEKDKARADDVPRIKELSRKLREAEAERDRLRTTSATQQQPAAQAQEQQVAAPQAQTIEPPKPPAGGFNTMDELQTYLDARDKYNREQWQAEEQTRQATTQLATSWKTRCDEAAKVHDDFKEVALGPTKIQPGSLMDAFILHSDHGAEILYRLQSDEPERERIAALPPVQQAEALTLLGQEVAPTRNTARPERPPVPAHAPAPRPPNLVRTAPQRTAEEAPDPEKASLREHEKFYPIRRFRR